MSNIWFESEGDNWYARNREKLGKKLDLPLRLMELYSIEPQKALEIGASNGYRLARIQEKYNTDVVAVEPSNKAVEEGRKLYQKVKFIRSACEEFETEERFDLVILNFVLHWICREHLYTCIAKIDEFLQDGGYLIIGDFGTEHHIKKQYHHLKDEEIYTWKMPYWELFTKSGRYLEIARLRFDHDNNKLSSEIDIENMGTIVLLKKKEMYVEQ